VTLIGLTSQIFPFRQLRSRHFLLFPSWPRLSIVCIGSLRFTLFPSGRRHLLLLWWAVCFFFFPARPLLRTLSPSQCRLLNFFFANASSTLPARAIILSRLRVSCFPANLPSILFPRRTCRSIVLLIYYFLPPSPPHSIGSTWTIPVSTSWQVSHTVPPFSSLCGPLLVCFSSLVAQHASFLYTWSSPGHFFLSPILYLFLSLSIFLSLSVNPLKLGPPDDDSLFRWPFFFFSRLFNVPFLYRSLHFPALFNFCVQLSLPPCDGL